jgi:hypothetical protein
MAVYLNTFSPICANKFGRNSVTENNLPHFIDGSCRREPDFENPYPAITQLCRPGKLVPRLKNGDLVIYLTKNGRYGENFSHWKFIGILEVISLYQNHNSAATFYTNNSIPISQNIFCANSNPLNLNLTHGICGFKHGNLSPTRIIQIWNEFYRIRSIKYSNCAITKVWKKHIYLSNALILNHNSMINIFGRIPGTQNPPKLTDAEWENFKIIMNI